MKKMKILWMNKKLRIVFCVSTGIMLVLLFASIVVTQHPFLYNTICSVLGSGKRSLVSENGEELKLVYEGDYDNKEDALEAANLLTERIEEEGIIMLKNEEAALPLPQGSRVTVFGKNSVNLVIGGSGSSASSSDSNADLYTSLSNAGYEYNTDLKAFYDSSASGSGRGTSPAMTSQPVYGFATAETPLSEYGTNLQESYQDYNDAAIVVISRIGGEGFDTPRSMMESASNHTPVEGAGSAEDHYLELDANEKALLQEACDNFDKVVLLINCSTTMEVGFLKQPVFHDEVTGQDYDYTNIKSALVIGYPGAMGANAIGRVLNGTVTPSGHTTDTFVWDFTKDPSYNNFGNNGIENGNAYIDASTGNVTNYFYVDYEEGIYVGYRYWETRGYTEAESGNNGWYDENVVFPFGYGLSYSTFDWELVNGEELEGSMSADQDITVKVNVTNTGAYPGKDVVQLYVTTPYYEGEIEKAHKVLVGFAKTPLLYPDASNAAVGQPTADGEHPNEAEVEITFQPYDFASYDYSDANGNGFSGYELDEGDYIFSVSSDAHTEIIDFILSVPQGGYRFENDQMTGEKVENRFDNVSNNIAVYLSRTDWEGTWPTVPTVEDRTVSAEFLDTFSYVVNDSSSDPWYSGQAPIQAETELASGDTVKIYELTGKAYDDEMWDVLLDQLTIADLVKLVSIGNYQTIAIDSIGKPRTYDPDGPEGFAQFMGDPAIYDTCTYCGESVLAATWNIELAYELGVMIGNEGVLGNAVSGGGDGTPYSGWYAPAMNIHRSQFGGRNWEYYSEDGLLSGKFAAEVVKGTAEKGVYAYIKHFVLNEQETNRDSNGLITWANEQAMREIYFKPFELCIKTGKCTAVMSSFNRIGSQWTGGSYELLTEVLRNEWGFRGMVVTDYNLSRYMNPDQMLRAGGDIVLSQSKNPSDTSSATAITAMRRAAHNILYTVANSNAMNGLGEGVEWKYSMPTWVILLIGVDILVFAILLLWNAMAWRKEDKK